MCSPCKKQLLHIWHLPAVDNTVLGMTEDVKLDYLVPEKLGERSDAKNVAAERPQAPVCDHEAPPASWVSLCPVQVCGRHSAVARLWASPLDNRYPQFRSVVFITEEGGTGNDYTWAFTPLLLRQESYSGELGRSCGSSVTGAFWQHYVHVFHQSCS